MPTQSNSKDLPGKMLAAQIRYRAQILGSMENEHVYEATKDFTVDEMRTLKHALERATTPTPPPSQGARE